MSACGVVLSKSCECIVILFSVLNLLFASYTDCEGCEVHSNPSSGACGEGDHKVQREVTQDLSKH